MEKRSILAIGIALLTIATFPVCLKTNTSQPNKNTALRFDGLYYRQGENYCAYIRFYDDGVVIEASIFAINAIYCNPDPVIKWFRKENIKEKDISNGRYEIKGAKIQFSTTSEAGIVSYQGVVQKNALLLDVFSHINGHRAREKYFFIEIPKINENASN